MSALEGTKNTGGARRPAGDAPEPGATMTVRVVDRSGWGRSGAYPAIRQVTISARCPACGGRRGTPRNHNFHEDGEWLSCDRWDNLCGHVDRYEAVLAEAAT